MENEDAKLIESNRVDAYPENIPYRPGAAGYVGTTRKEIRGKIGFKVGTNQDPEAPLTIATLNSAYAYLTGEFKIEPRLVNTSESLGRGRLRTALAVKVAPEDDRMASYVPTPESERDWTTRAYRKAELMALYRVLAETEDQRAWAQPHDASTDTATGSDDGD